ncbi:MAG: hypothetical protein [Caudoviricetes sp.]|nr:MAG: hypothetical protein [Caudoviricetes sp.]
MKLDIIISNPIENDVGQTITYESNDAAKIFEVFINNVVYLDVSENKVNSSIVSYLKKLQNKVVHRQYYDDNKAIITILLNIEKVLVGLNQTYQDENDVDEANNEIAYINAIEEVRDKLLFTVVKKIPELADDLLKSISSNNNNSITYYDN